jgi:glyoxylase-like metal-dependent hydrolase (beta-lactamase superfamily II)/rhodanese-related sulfurtransferase
MTLTTSTPSIAPADLAERLARSEAFTLLDVRDDATWSIEAPAATLRHVPAATVLADPAAVAGELPGPAVVVCTRGITAARVAEALREHGADVEVLEGGMRAWLGVLQARAVDLGVPGLTVHQIQRPGRGCLSYLVASGGRALVVDPTPDGAFHLALANELGVEITDVVDTHLHADHLSGARALAAQTGATLRLPAAALERGVVYAAAVRALRDGDELSLGDVTVRALALPGHTSDMTGLLVAGRALIGGDSLFADGLARPDLQRRDPEGARAMARRLHQTLRGRVLTLDPGTILLPGHTHPGVLAEAIAPALADVRVPELALDDADAFADALLTDMPARPANFETVIAVNAGTEPYDPDLEAGGNSCASSQSIHSTPVRAR